MEMTRIPEYTRMLLAIAGAGDYSPAFVEQYMKDEYAKQPVSFLYRKFGRHGDLVAFATLIGAFAGIIALYSGLQAAGIETQAPFLLIPAALVAVFLYLMHDFGKPAQWQHTEITDRGMYYNGHSFLSVPIHVLVLMENIWKFFPEAKFSIHHIGDDPVIDCKPSPKHVEIYTVCIYDNNGIIEPPKV